MLPLICTCERFAFPLTETFVLVELVVVPFVATRFVVDRFVNTAVRAFRRVAKRFEDVAFVKVASTIVSFAKLSRVVVEIIPFRV